MLKRVLILILLGLGLVSCGNRPGPLEGTWKVTGLMPMTVIFRSGETEALGMIDQVSYEIVGNDVLVTYEDGMAKGTTMRYTMTGPNTAKTDLFRLKRIKR